MGKATIKPEKELKIIWYMAVLIFYTATLIMILMLFLFSDANIWVLTAMSAIWLLSLIIILIWVPAAYKALEYYIEEDSIKMKGGVFWRKHVTVPNKKITNIDITQGPFERFLKIGTVHIQTAGAGGQQGQKAELKIGGVKDMDKIRDTITGNLNFNTGAGNVIEKIPATIAEITYVSEKEILLEILEILKGMDEKLKK
jgi:membrane protein YdbS with pleckstrin-like domain